MARAPFNVFVIPYGSWAGGISYCVLRRADMENVWQFVAGGGEDAETPMEAAVRETFEEIGVSNNSRLTPLGFMDYVPAFCFSKEARQAWGDEISIIPNYAFAVECPESSLALSREHTGYEWLHYDEAVKRLTYDGNKTALWELRCRLEQKK